MKRVNPIPAQARNLLIAAQVKIAGRSMVLLKNERQTLPLDKNIPARLLVVEAAGR